MTLKVLKIKCNYCKLFISHIEGVVEDGSGKKKYFIGITFTKINFVTDILHSDAWILRNGILF